MQLTKEQQKLVLNNHNLIYKCLKKYNLSAEEYYDIAAYALCKAALHFDPDKGCRFSYGVPGTGISALTGIESAPASERETAISILSSKVSPIPIIPPEQILRPAVRTCFNVSIFIS